MEKDSQWTDAHDKLKICMQKEVSMMREILANMHREEHSLLMSDRNFWTQVMQERSELIERLCYLRVERLDLTKSIEKMVCLSDKTTHATLEQILPTEDENSCEILSLRDQMLALMERMNFQNCRNEILFEQFEHGIEHPFYYQPIPAEIQKPKRKASIATYNFKR